MESWRVKLTLAPIPECRTRGWTSSVFQILGMTQSGIEPSSLSALVVRSQPTVSVRSVAFNLGLATPEGRQLFMEGMRVDIS